MFYERFPQLKRFLVPAFTKKMASIACHNIYSIMIKPHVVLYILDSDEILKQINII
jgi:hypothetical protein